VGEKVILLCDSVTCWIKGYEKIQQQITQKLGIELGETTTDQRYTLLPMTCLGACDKAPVMMIGDDLYENLDVHSVLELFNEQP
jgi:NADH-quinone oxidoreductase subunit E